MKRKSEIPAGSVIVARIMVIVAVMVLGLTACSPERKQWNSAQAADSLEAYDNFLQRYPQSDRVTQAKARIAQLMEERDWNLATTADTPMSYRQFVSQYPLSRLAQEARIRIESFALADLPAPAKHLTRDDIEEARTEPGASVEMSSSEVITTGTDSPPIPPTLPVAEVTTVSESVSVPESVATSVPPPPPENPDFDTSAAPEDADDLREAQLSSRGYGIQLGAFGNESRASEEWRRLSAQFSELTLLQPYFVPVETATGTLHRLQAHVPDEATAREICGSLARASQDCVVVLPPDSN